MQILDIDKAKERIVYLYCNPAKANLVESITEYPGVSSWEAYARTEKSLTAEVQVTCPLVPEKSIKPLGGTKIDTYQEILRKNVQREITLTLQPHAWMAVFGITDEKDVSAIHQEIVKSIYAQEAQLKIERTNKGKSVFTRTRLTTQRPTVKGWKPKKKERKIFFLSSCKKLRLQFLRHFEQFCSTCKEMYQAWKEGRPPKDWPPEAYLPAQP